MQVYIPDYTSIDIFLLILAFPGLEKSLEQPLANMAEREKYWSINYASIKDTYASIKDNKRQVFISFHWAANK